MAFWKLPRGLGARSISASGATQWRGGFCSVTDLPPGNAKEYPASVLLCIFVSMTRQIPVLLLLLGLFLPTNATALGSAGLQSGFQVVDGEAFLGAHFRLDIAQIGNRASLQVYPNLDVFLFDSDFTRWSIDIDLIIPVDLGIFVEPYAGLGLGITHEAGKDFGSETTGDLNLVGGFDFVLGLPVHPFAEVEASIGGTDVVSLIAGVGYHF